MTIYMVVVSPSRGSAKSDNEYFDEQIQFD